jgi:hypothetical protein
MLEVYPTTLCDKPRELPARVDQMRLRNAGFCVMTGLNRALAEQLVEASKEDHIVDSCPGDSIDRFANVEAVGAWLSKGRLALPLVRKLDSNQLQLAGFGWTGPETPGDEAPIMPGASITFAIRLYNKALHKHLSFPYTLAILAANKALHRNKGIWLDTNSNNLVAINTYEKAGFVYAGEATTERNGIQQTRLYMVLGKWTLA